MRRGPSFVRLPPEAVGPLSFKKGGKERLAQAGRVPRKGGRREKAKSEDFRPPFSKGGGAAPRPALQLSAITKSAVISEQASACPPVSAKQLSCAAR